LFIPVRSVAQVIRDLSAKAVGRISLVLSDASSMQILICTD
jgi:hypothetical protein